MGGAVDCLCTVAWDGRVGESSDTILQKSYSFMVRVLGFRVPICFGPEDRLHVLQTLNWFYVLLVLINRNVYACLL
jgi:hypothetical protein